MSRQLACFLLLIGCLFPVARATSPIGPITSISVTATAIGPKNEGCADFVLTREQVRAFFDTAILISRSQQHDFFLYGSCAAQGTAQTRYDSWTWEIRSLGTATLTATNGEMFLLGDPAQESSLGDDGRGQEHAHRP